MTSILTTSELVDVEVKWVKASQQEVYNSVLTKIMSNSLSRKRTTLIYQLWLFLGLICCGRIHNAPLSVTAKSSLLLPPKHPLTSLIIQDVHVRLFHAGANATLTILRHKFWIPTGRQSNHCSTCHRYVGTPFQSGHHCH